VNDAPNPITAANETIAPMPPAAPAAPTVDAAAPATPQLVGGFYYGTGRRKTAVARVRLRAGPGQVTVNTRPYDKYFTEPRDRDDVVAPLRTADVMGKMDVFVSVEGGGPSGQAGAIRLGVARALVKYSGDNETKLRDNGYLTRDARKVERKKYGRSGARKRFQFSKR